MGGMIDVPAPSAAVPWYRSPLPPGEMKKLHRRSDLLGFLQAGGYLAVLAATGTASWLAAYAWRWPWWAVALLVFLHGTGGSFLINAVHELTHGTVFQTKALNAFFARLFSFLGWINFEMFETSHARHHRYTLHPPDDLEVVLPIRIVATQFFLGGIVNPRWFFKWGLDNIVRIALGRFQGEWELMLHPADKPETRRGPVRWARLLLLGHGLVLAFSVWRGLWLLPVLVSLMPCYGGWLFFLCNNTQHIGLQDNVSDFRLCCRTFTVNPVVRFLYWHMNYHIEHHMYAAVPCYRLGRLHRLIRHDLPPTPRGIAATWREIAMIQEQQEADPSYQHQPPLPVPSLSELMVRA